MLTLLILCSTSFEKLTPPTNATTIEEKMARIVIYSLSIPLLSFLILSFTPSIPSDKIFLTFSIWLSAN